jgi:hypothetical protein
MASVSEITVQIRNANEALANLAKRHRSIQVKLDKDPANEGLEKSLADVKQQVVASREKLEALKVERVEAQRAELPAIKANVAELRKKLEQMLEHAESAERAAKDWRR